MTIVVFCHSIRSDWNHGNAHFLRGVVSELLARGHRVRVFEPADAWSATNLAADAGAGALEDYRSVYPGLCSEPYELSSLDLDRVLADAGLVLVHEWNDHALVAEIGAHRARSGRGYRLFFHDTHHRSVSEPDLMAKYELRHYDGVLTFGRIIRDTYLDNGWAARAWTWHEAADVRVFLPRPHTKREGDLVWIGNWGDEERTAELEEFLIEPVKRLKLRARIYGVRYPPHALQRLADAGIEYGGWLPNYCVPDVFAGYSVTVHVPRRPYVRALPGVPTIRMFEALACGIPLVSAPWDDAEGNFERGRDYLAVRDGEEMTAALDCLLNDQRLARELGEHGRRTILARHTCAHRVDELLNIVRELGPAEAVASHEPLRASAPSGAVGLRP